MIGSKTEAEEIKQQLELYLRNNLKLELSKTKTLITHARTESAKFLGYEIRIHQENTKHTHGRRSINGKIGLLVPHSVIPEKSLRYMKNGKAVHRPVLMNDSDFTIISTYQSEYRGLVEYYRLAYNLSSAFGFLKWLMEISLTKTLARKFKLSVKKIYARYGTTILVDGKVYKGLQVKIERTGKKPLVAEWGGIPLKWDIKAILNDHPAPVWGKRTELEKRLLANICEYCGDTENIEVHHIRALKDLQKYTGRVKPEWVEIMAARLRKTMILCRVCHQDVTFGRPMRRQKLPS